jgi:hypothetical protein
MIAWGRFVLATALALLGMLALATQLVAWVFDQQDALGEAVAVVGGVKLYAPWQVLVWTMQWFAHDAWKSVLHLGLVAMALLAAFALAALAQAIEPPSFRLRLWRPGFERWGRLSQRSLLRGDGLALVGVRRHAFARPDILRADVGHALLLGAPVHTDDALIAAVANWTGALVFIEARDLASRLPRQDMLRFTPGRSDAIAINPLLGVRGGAHAWSDALTLARGFLRSQDGMLVASFAALVLDTLAHGQPHARSFSGMRQALADPQRRLAEFCARWADRADSDLGPPTGELTRIARYWRRDGEAALRAIRDIDIHLRLFSDGDHALATEGHQLRFADLVSGAATSLVIQMPPGWERLSAPLVSALLAQLVTACGSASDLDCFGRRKQSELLIVIEANAIAALATDSGSVEAAHMAGKKKAAPLFNAPKCNACERGVRFLVQAACVSDAGAVIGVEPGDLVEDVPDVFAAIAAIGPQTETCATFAATLAGQVWVWKRWKHQAGRLSRWLLPHWERAVAWAVPSEDLRTAEAGDALLLLAGMKPIRGRSLVTDRAIGSFVDSASIARASHDWDAPALPLAAVSVSSALAPPSPEKENAGANRPPPIGSSKLRRALSRRAAPELNQDRGERLI